MSKKKIVFKGLIFLVLFVMIPFFVKYDVLAQYRPVPKTGYTACYDENGNPRDCTGTGEDGEYQIGVERFTDNGDGTITDRFTGLMWLKDINCIATNYPGFDNDEDAGDGAVTWQHALDFVAGINGGTYPLCAAGYTDWRLPNINELISFGSAVPLMLGSFHEAGVLPLWSSSTDLRQGPNFAWAAYINNFTGFPKSEAYPTALPVRDCEEGPCNGNFDYDSDVDGMDAVIFKIDFGRRDCL